MLTLALAGEGRGLFFTSIQDSESRSGRLAERPLGIVLRLEVSKSVLVFCFTGVETLGDPGADKAKISLVAVEPQMADAGRLTGPQTKARVGGGEAYLWAPRSPVLEQTRGS